MLFTLMHLASRDRVTPASHIAINSLLAGALTVMLFACVDRGSGGHNPGES